MRALVADRMTVVLCMRCVKDQLLYCTGLDGGTSGSDPDWSSLCLQAAATWAAAHPGNSERQTRRQQRWRLMRSAGPGKQPASAATVLQWLHAGVHALVFDTCDVAVDSLLCSVAFCVCFLLATGMTMLSTKPTMLPWRSGQRQLQRLLRLLMRMMEQERRRKICMQAWPSECS